MRLLEFVLGIDGLSSMFFKGILINLTDNCL